MNQLNMSRASSEAAEQYAKAQLKLAQTEAQLTSMLNSKSWKVAAPLRKAYDLVQQFRTRRAMTVEEINRERSIPTGHSQTGGD